ncbi:MAG: nuclear transport factor 2 family protein [Rhodococcus sp. (in: high G+C Gram-positive bacteria)]|nr:MAG: nuclear transport factor 2 family protein [Rhodococcus sp. (in: high G+C Gram-positive bacteria)]
MAEDMTMVERLTAIEDIKQLKARYFRLLDQHKWDDFAELFSSTLVVEIAESTSGPKDRDSFVASVRAHLDSAVTVHQGHTPEITIIDADRASGIWAMFDLVEPPVDSEFPLLVGYGHYLEEYVREDSKWRISRLELTRIKRTTGMGADMISDQPAPMP